LVVALPVLMPLLLVLEDLVVLLGVAAAVVDDAAS